MNRPVTITTYDGTAMPAPFQTKAPNTAAAGPTNNGDGGSMPVQGAKIPGRDTTVQFLATGPQKLGLDRPVLDETGLTGGYDFVLSWRPDPSQFHGTGDKVRSDPNDPDLFTAMQEQLGLKLTAQKGMAPVIITDHADKPSEN